MRPFLRPAPPRRPLREDEAGPAALRRRLQQVDPAAAEAIEPNNIRRIIRALEVVEITDRPFSATAPTKRYRRPSLVIGLRDDWTALTERIERRARAMWDGGLLDEVRRLDAAGLRGGRRSDRTAAGNALGRAGLGDRAGAPRRTRTAA